MTQNEFQKSQNRLEENLELIKCGFTLVFFSRRPTHQQRTFF